MTWAQVDDTVNWLIGQLGDSYIDRVDAAAAALSGPMNDDERHLRRMKHGELPCALASLRGRDRQRPVQGVTREEERALTLGALARACEEHNVRGWRERLARVVTVDDRTYRSIHFEVECAAIFARSGDNEIEFVPEGDPNKSCEMRIANLVDVECKRLEGKLSRDRRTPDLWRRLQQSLWKRVAALGSEYLFVVETAGPPTDADISWIVARARELLVESREISVATDDERVRCHFSRAPVTVTTEGLRAQGMPIELLRGYELGRVETRAVVEDNAICDGIVCTFAFRADRELDMVHSVRKVMGKARGQLSRDRPSITVVDAYEPLLELPPVEREAQRRLIYSALEADLDRRGRPTGVFLAAPAPDQDLVTRTFVYAGNKNPSTPFPEAFELFSGWTPAQTVTEGAS
ncbi:hypothetical protein [Streptomyces sp. NPDC001758]